jgi:hypothetical protein
MFAVTEVWRFHQISGTCEARRFLKRGEQDAKHGRDDTTCGASKFDGNWSVVVVTRSGPCDAAYRFSGQIFNGAIAYGGGLGSVDFAGRVRPNGAALLRVSSGANYAVASGRLGAARGSGTWRGQSSSGRCSGVWSATRS